MLFTYPRIGDVSRVQESLQEQKFTRREWNKGKPDTRLHKICSVNGTRTVCWPTPKPPWNRLCALGPKHFWEPGKDQFQNHLHPSCFLLKEKIVLNTFFFPWQLQFLIYFLKGQYCTGTWHWVKGWSVTRIRTVMSSARMWSREPGYSACVMPRLKPCRVFGLMPQSHTSQFHSVP